MARNGIFEISCIASCMFLDQYPFAATFNEFVEHHTHVSQSEAANVEAEEFGCVTSAELQANVRWGGMLQSRILSLLGNLVYVG